MSADRALAVRVAEGGNRLQLVRNSAPFPLVAEFGGGSTPAPLVAVLARQCAASPEMAHLLVDVAAFFATHPKSRKRAGTLPKRIMRLLEELELDGWVK